MSSWWVMAGGVAGLAGSVLWLVLWSFRLRQALAEKGWRYTSRVSVLPLFYVLPGSMQVVLREMAVIEHGGTVDIAFTYALAALVWIILATLVAGILLDAWRKGPNRHDVGGEPGSTGLQGKG